MCTFATWSRFHLFLSLSEFDDWDIIYHNTHFSSSIPTEEELSNVLQLICEFHQKNPSLLVGVMDFTVHNLPYYIVAQLSFLGCVT